MTVLCQKPTFAAPLSFSSALPPSAFGLHALHSLGHEPAKLVGLTSVRLELSLGIVALKGHHAQYVFGISEFFGQREASLCVLVGKTDRQRLDVPKTQTSSRSMEPSTTLALWRP
jgi:hypothetical protein